MKSFKKLILMSVIVASTAGLSGCQIGVLSLDIGMGFEEGAYVISE